MSAIKLELEHTEYHAVVCYAEALGVSPEDIAYAALDRLMQTCEAPELNRAITEIRERRRQSRTPWGTAAQKPASLAQPFDDEPVLTRFF